ncbi:putative transporter small subunit [Nocardioides sp. JQ2195]|nr:putative transporter small subunit [Nocardioides sp. JQ2195]
METALLTAYVLIWPLLAALVLLVISVAFVKEYRTAREKGEDIV